MSNKFILQQEDGTVANGDARGEGAVDLQMARTNADQVSNAIGSTISGGYNNKVHPFSLYGTVVGGRGNISGDQFAISGGEANQANGRWTVAFGQSNIASSNYSTISGGSSNTASTNTHATVVGGYQNTASGQYSVAGGYSSVASNTGAVALGYDATASGYTAVALGASSSATGTRSVSIGPGSAQSDGAVSIGNYSNAVGGRSVAIGDNNISNAGSSIAMGTRANAYLLGQFAVGVDFYLNTPTNVQYSNLVAKKQDTLTSASTTVLSLDGTGTTNLIIPDGTNRAWNVTVKWVAVCTATGSGTTAVGDVAIATDSFMFKKVSGTSSIGSVQNLQNSQDATMAGATCSYAVGGSQDLQITFTAPASANATTFRVVAKVELTEVAW